MGRSNAAFFRLNAIESRSPRDGRVIEELGYYDPRHKDQSKQFVAKLDRCQYWLSVGAVPSETVSSLLKKSGVEHKSLRLPRPGKPKAVLHDFAALAVGVHDDALDDVFTNRTVVVAGNLGELDPVRDRFDAAHFDDQGIGATFDRQVHRGSGRRDPQVDVRPEHGRVETPERGGRGRCVEGVTVTL
jgi:ribosomal protein S16